MEQREEAAVQQDHIANANARMITTQFFRLLPVQVLRSVVGSINNLIATFFASNFIGSLALSAWGIYAPFDMFVGAISTVLLAGSQVMCGKFMGRNEEEGMQEVFSLNLMVSLAIGIVLNILLFAVGIFDLSALFIDDETIRAAFNPLLIGISFDMVPMIVCQQVYAFLSLEQQGKRSTVAILATAVSIAVFNFLFIVVFDMGTLGLGLAPAIANTIALVIAASYFTTDASTFKLRLSSHHVEFLKEIALIGLPAALLPAYQTLRGTIVNGLVLSYVGAVGISAFAAANSLLNIFWAIPAGVQAVCRVLFSMYVGEEDRRSVTDTMRAVIFRALPLMCIIAVGIIVLAHPFTLIFFREDAQDAFQMTVNCFRILPLCMPLSLFCLGFATYDQVADKHAVLHIEAAFDGVICVAGFSALLVPVMGLDGVNWANVLNGVVCVLIFVVYAIIAKKGIPRTMDELMVIPADFGAPDSDRLDISIRSLDEVVGTSKAIQTFCLEHGVDERRSFFSALCMEEMAGNIVDHGFTKDSKKHSVDVRVVYLPENLVLRIKDDCVPFDPATRRTLFDPDDPAKNIGVHLVYGIADDVDYRHLLGMNVLTMKIAHEDAAV